jgi:Uncharacterized protein conserved in bacteria (DUF2188)
MEEALHRSRYVVLEHDGDWQIRTAHRHVESTFDTKQQAVSAAIELAEQDGHASEVLVRHEDDRFVTEWTHVMISTLMKLLVPVGQTAWPQRSVVNIPQVIIRLCG